MNRGLRWGRGAVLAACVAILIRAPARTTGRDLVADELIVATSGGLIQDVGRQTLWGPAARHLGVAVREESFDNGYQLVRLQSASGRVSLDVVELPSFLAMKGYHEGMIAPLDYGVIGTGGFSPRTSPPYCIGMLSASWVMGWNTDHFGANPPLSWADFWDVRRFPGRRGAQVGAEAQLEIALLADGVAPNDVYPTLSRPGGIARAIHKWEQLRPHIDVWWSSGSQLAQLMKNGELDLAIGWNGRFEQVIATGSPVRYTYSGGILTTDCWAVPTAAPHRLLAMRMIGEMVKAEAQARFASAIKYGPANAGAYATGLLPGDLARKLPTHPANLALQLPEDDEWWAQHSTEAERAFDEMRSK